MKLTKDEALALLVEPSAARATRPGLLAEVLLVARLSSGSAERQA